MNDAMQNYTRSIQDVTRDIRVKTGQFLMDAIEIGRLLFEAKALVPSGGWMEYVEKELPFSQSWANNYMRLYKELGGTQLSLFDNSQAIGNLTPTAALELLALPPQEREEFIENNDVENMSTRELHKAIQERDAARRVAEEKEEAANQAEFEVATLKEQVDRAEKEQRVAKQRADQLLEILNKAKAAEKKAKDDLKAAKENPKIPESMLEKMRKEIEAQAAENATRELQKKLEAAEKAAHEAAQLYEETEKKLVAAQKQIQLSNPDAAVFKSLFTQVQEDFNRLQEALQNVQKAAPETGEKLRRAVLTVLDKLREEVSGK